MYCQQYAPICLLEGIQSHNGSMLGFDYPLSFNKCVYFQK